MTDNVIDDASFDRAVTNDLDDLAAKTHRHFFVLQRGIFTCSCGSTADRHGRVREAA